MTKQKSEIKPLVLLLINLIDFTNYNDSALGKEDLELEIENKLNKLVEIGILEESGGEDEG